MNKRILSLPLVAVVFAGSVLFFGCSRPNYEALIPKPREAPAVNGIDDLVAAGRIFRDLKGWKGKTRPNAPQSPGGPRETSDAVVAIWAYHYGQKLENGKRVRTGPAADMDDIERAKLTDRALADSAEVFQYIDAALEKPIASPPTVDYTTALPNYISQRDLVRWLLLRVDRRIALGDNSGALNDFARIVKIAKGNANGGPLIAYLVSLTELGMSVPKIYALLPQLNDPDLKRAETLLAGLGTDPPSPERAFEVERDSTKRTYAMLRTDPRNLERMMTDADLYVGTAPKESWRDIDWQALWDSSLAYFTLNTDFPSIIREVDAMYADAITTCEAPDALREKMPDYPARFSLNRATSPNFKKACQKRDENLAFIRMAAITAAAERQKRHTGAYPPTLEALMAADSTITPVVATDPFTSRFMFYSVADGVLKIYCAGPDGDDDGGRPLNRPYSPTDDGDFTPAWFTPASS